MIKCPKCGKSHYVECGGTTTCIGWTPEYRDGVLVNSDPNKTTWCYRCLECGEHFTSDSAIYEAERTKNITNAMATIISSCQPFQTVSFYYEIVKLVSENIEELVCIVEKEEIAKDFCSKHSGYTYHACRYMQSMSVAN